MKQKHWQVSIFDKTSETIKNNTFYTTDTEAYLVFELIDEDFTPESATVTVYNVYGKATINASVEVADGIVRYEMPEEAIGHPGGWRTQVIFTKDNEDYTTGIINFEVGGHLLDNKKPAIVDIENWNSFIAHARELIDDWEQLEEIRQANEQQRELAESARQNEFEANETSRQANELVREEAENNRQSTFEANETERQSEFETNETERENAFKINESARQVNEQARESAESVRVANEEERISKDSERDSKIDSKADKSYVDNQDAALTAQVAEKANKTQEEWITPTLTSGWVAWSDDLTPGFMKDSLGFVHLKGVLKSGTTGENVFKLPVGYRPLKNKYFISCGDSNYSLVNVLSVGIIQFTMPNNSTGFRSLDGITFKAER